MLEKICNNHLYTTQVNEESYPISYDEFIQEIIKEEDEELQEKIDDYYWSIIAHEEIEYDEESGDEQ